MAPTPVRVRGKRRKLDSAALADQKNGAVRSNKSLADVMDSLRARVTITSLPSEILEDILLYSGNLSLPRSNTWIGIQLSSLSTRLRLFISAFHETWNQNFGVPLTAFDRAPYPQNSGSGVTGVPDSAVDGDWRRQTEQLELRWVDIDFILQAQQTWANLNARGRHYGHPLEPSQIWPKKQRSVPSCHHEFNGGFSHFNARECFEADYKLMAEPRRCFLGRDTWMMTEIHPLTRIPRDLITGPWDDGQQKRLFWLCRAGALTTRGGYVGHQVSQLPWEDKLECLRNMILDVIPNMLVLSCIYVSEITQGLPPDVCRAEVVKIKKRLEWGDDSEFCRIVLRDIIDRLELEANA